MCMSLQKVLFKSNLRKGFTLLELTVSIAIMAIILGISFSGGPSAIMRVSLADNTYKAEMLLREAQLQGSSIASLNNTFGGAGVYFDRSTPTRIVKFKDRSILNLNRAISIGNGLYDTVPTDELDTVYAMTNGHRFGKVCVATTSPAVFFCNGENTAHIPAITSLTVSFNRPKQTAHIYINNSVAVDYSTACIQFDSNKSPANGFVKSVLVYKSGMISKRIGACN